MKKFKPVLSTAIIIFILLPFSAMAIDVALQWDRNVENDLAGYVVYCWRTSDFPADNMPLDNVFLEATIPIDDLADPQNPEYVFLGLDDGIVYTFAVTAFDLSGLESDHSNAVDTTSAPTPSPSPSPIPVVNDSDDSGGGGCFLSDVFPE